MARRIAVVGGGVIGCSIAWHLAEDGLGQVTLYERDRLGSGTTWHSAGNITWKPFGDSDRPVLYMFETIERLRRDHEAETGWLTTGRLLLARTRAALEGFAGPAVEAERRGFDSRLLEPAEAADRHPLLNSEALAGAWYLGLSGRLNPADLTAAYARAARRSGAEILEGCKVEALQLRGGRVAAVVTDEGPREADAVVVAAGLWSRPLLAPLGLAVAQTGCEHFYVIARPQPRLARETPSFVSPEDLVYGREEVGGFLVGCFDEAAKTIDAERLPEPFAFTLLDDDWDKVAPYYERAIELFPTLGKAPVARFVNGPESFTPDGNPLIGQVDGIEGLYLCTAMSSHGVTLSAAAGRIVADQLAGEPPSFPADLYAPARFGARASDPAWLDREISGTPSRYYRQSNARQSA